jgi:hypothetical protein
VTTAAAVSSQLLSMPRIINGRACGDALLLALLLVAVAKSLLAILSLLTLLLTLLLLMLLDLLARGRACCAAAVL